MCRNAPEEIRSACLRRETERQGEGMMSCDPIRKSLEMIEMSGIGKESRCNEGPAKDKTCVSQI